MTVVKSCLGRDLHSTIIETEKSCSFGIDGPDQLDSSQRKKGTTEMIYTAI